MSTSQDQLSALEMDAWGGFLRLHTVLYRELDRRLTRNAQMSISAYEVLLRLTWAGEEGMRMNQLAQQVFMTSGGLTRLADRLERDGLIVRTPSSEDGRGYQARTTPAGRRALKRANRQHLQDVRELFLDHLTDSELEVLATVWRRVKSASGDDVEILRGPVSGDRPARPPG